MIKCSLNIAFIERMRVRHKSTTICICENGKFVCLYITLCGTKWGGQYDIMKYPNSKLKTTGQR